MLAEAGAEGEALIKTALAAIVWDPSVCGAVATEIAPTLHHVGWWAAVEQDRLCHGEQSFPDLTAHAELQITLRCLDTRPSDSATEVPKPE